MDKFSLMADKVRRALSKVEEARNEQILNGKRVDQGFALDFLDALHELNLAYDGLFSEESMSICDPDSLDIDDVDYHILTDEEPLVGSGISGKLIEDKNFVEWRRTIPTTSPVLAIRDVRDIGCHYYRVYSLDDEELERDLYAIQDWREKHNDVDYIALTLSGSIVAVTLESSINSERFDD